MFLVNLKIVIVPCDNPGEGEQNEDGVTQLLKWKYFNRITLYRTFSKLILDLKKNECVQKVQLNLFGVRFIVFLINMSSFHGQCF